MSDAAVKFLIEKYKLDEMKARAIVAFYRSSTDEPQYVGVPGLTPEEQILIQQQQALPGAQPPIGAITTGTLPTTQTATRVPAVAQPSVGPVPEKQKYGGVNPWWYAIGAWNFVTDPIWIYMFLKQNSGQAVRPITQTIAGYSPPGLVQRAGQAITGRGASTLGSLEPLGTAGTGVDPYGNVSRVTPTVQAQPGFWSRAGAGLRGTGQSITSGVQGLREYLFGGAGSLGAIYGLGASTAIGAAIPVVGIAGARLAGGALAPEWNAELSKQGYNEFIRPWFPTITAAPKTQEEWQLQQAAAPYWQGWAQAWNQLTSYSWPWEKPHEAYTPTY